MIYGLRVESKQDFSEMPDWMVDYSANDDMTVWDKTPKSTSEMLGLLDFFELTPCKTLDLWDLETRIRDLFLLCTVTEVIQQ